MDMDGERKMHSDLKDKDLEIKFLDPAQQRLLLVAGPQGDSVELVMTLQNGMYLHQTARAWARPFRWRPWSR